METMKTQQTHTKDDAVSPVVAVMLMLVVTIIIAALVSTFAGGLTDTTGKAPVVVLTGEYSQSDGLAVKNAGGESLSTMDTEVWLRPTNDFGDYTHLAWHLADKAYIYNNSIVDNFIAGNKASSKEDGGWKYGVGYYYTGVGTVSSGESFYVYPNASVIQAEGDGAIKPSATAAYNFSLPQNIGKKITVELVQNGKVFAKANIPITA